MAWQCVYDGQAADESCCLGDRLYFLRIHGSGTGVGGRCFAGMRMAVFLLCGLGTGGGAGQGWRFGIPVTQGGRTRIYTMTGDFYKIALPDDKNCWPGSAAAAIWGTRRRTGLAT